MSEDRSGYSKEIKAAMRAKLSLPDWLKVDNSSEITRLRNALAAAEERERKLRAVLEQYAIVTNWMRPYIAGTDLLANQRIVFNVDSEHGFERAQRALANKETDHGST